MTWCICEERADPGQGSPAYWDLGTNSRRPTRWGLDINPKCPTHGEKSPGGKCKKLAEEYVRALTN